MPPHSERRPSSPDCGHQLHGAVVIVVIVVIVVVVVVVVIVAVAA